MCQNLDYSSDHFLIVIEIVLTLVEALLCQQQSWKKIDLEVIEIDVQNLQLSTQLDSSKAIN
jgi:hypothetical protein